MQVVALIDEENGVFGAFFPDFPGCTTVADSQDAIVGKAAEALAFHAEGLAEDGPLPEPRPLSEIARDPDFSEDLERSMILLVPYAPPGRARQCAG
jgi:predicted RNase H-like HicB family nuclease